MQTKDTNLLTKLALSPLSAAIALAAMLPSAQAAVFVVDAVKDSDGKSLNEALQASRENDEDDLIEFSSSLKDQTLTMSGVYAIRGETGNLTIDGSGAKNLSIKMLEKEGDVGFIALYGASISVNDVNLIINKPVSESEDEPVSPFSQKYSSSAFVAAYFSELNLENVSIGLGDKNREAVAGVFGFKYSALNLKNVVIDGSNNKAPEPESEEGYAGLSVGVGAIFSTNVSVDGAIFNELEGLGLMLVQYAEGFSGMNASVNNAVFTGIGHGDEENSKYAAIFAFNDGSEGTLATLDLSISNTTLSDNKGNAIVVVSDDSSAKSSVSVSNTTIVNNQKYDGGAAFFVDGNIDVNLAHTTITNNSSSKHLETEGYYAAKAAVHIEQDTSEGEGIPFPTLSISNSIIAGNTAHKYISEEDGKGKQAADIFITGVNEAEGGVVSSLIGVDLFLNEDEDFSDSGLYGKGVIYGKDPLFKEVGLKYNKKAETPTLCLSEKSPAVNAGDANLTKILGLELDQAGKKRLNDKAPDMGAVEFSSTCKHKSKDDGLFGSFGSLSLVSLFGLAFFRRKKQ